VISQRREALHNIGAIFETPSFYDYLSGFRNLAILSSYTAPTPDSRILEVIDWVGLTGREHSKVSTYSHGMRSRLALAQALLPKPQLLILDEPSDGLDPEGIHEMRHTILQLHRELGLTILLSSHLLFEVEQLCTHIAVLSQGRLLFAGTLDQARRRDQWVRLKVADFSKSVGMLTEAKLISQHRDAELVALEAGIGTDHLVRFLVERGMPVYQVSLDEESLESFYLRLMNRQRQETSRPCSTPI
jgi:ABC-2 type transport system ATP-binding protein